MGLKKLSLIRNDWVALLQYPIFSSSYLFFVVACFSFDEGLDLFDFGCLKKKHYKWIFVLHRKSANCKHVVFVSRVISKNQQRRVTKASPRHKDEFTFSQKNIRNASCHWFITIKQQTLKWCQRLNRNHENGTKAMKTFDIYMYFLWLM